MQKCKECDRPLLTATSECNVFYPDSEPYESGVEQETEYDSINEYVAVGILWCPEHGIQHTWIEEPRVAKAGINVYKTILNTVVEPIATQDEERLRDLHKWVMWLKEATDEEPRMLGETLERTLRYISMTVALAEEIPDLLCRTCDLVPATGDDGLCDGCRSAVVLERRE